MLLLIMAPFYSSVRVTCDSEPADTTPKTEAASLNLSMTCQNAFCEKRQDDNVCFTVKQ